MPRGPFPPGVPWWRPLAGAGAGGTAGAPAAPTLGTANFKGPFAPGDPPADTRIRKSLALLTLAFNSLVRKGLLIQGGKPDDFTLFQGAFRAARDPLPTDDFGTIGARPGMGWVNIETRAYFVAVYTATGAAEWIEVGGAGEDGAPGPAGPAGATGATGAAGQGVPAGGTAGQVLEKVNANDYNTQWATPSGGGSSVITSAFASRPAAGTSGRLWLPTDTPWISHSYDDGSAWANYRNGLLLSTPDAAGNWSVHNAVNGTASHAKGAIIISHSDAAATTYFQYKRASTVGSTFKITAGFYYTQGRTAANAYQNGGVMIGLLGAATGELVFIEALNENTLVQPTLSYSKWTNATTFSASYMNREELASCIPIYLQIEVDATNRYARYSTDGVNFSTLWTVAKTDFSQGDTPVIASFGRNSTAVCFHYKQE